MAANRTASSSDDRFSIRCGRSASEPVRADSLMAPSRASGVGSWYDGSTEVEQPANSRVAQATARDIPRWLGIGRAV